MKLLAVVAAFLGVLIQLQGDGASQSVSSFEYYQLKENEEATNVTGSYNISSLFFWEYKSFSHCSVSCGTGESISKAVGVKPVLLQ